MISFIHVNVNLIVFVFKKIYFLAFSFFLSFSIRYFLPSSIPAHQFPDVPRNL